MLSLVGPATTAKSALIIVDTQKCFTNLPSSDDMFSVCTPPALGGTDECERVGSLSVAKGQSIVPEINKLRTEKGCLFDMIIRSRDFHPPGHVSFSSAHFGDGSPNSGLDFMGGPISVGQAFDFSCVKAESGLLKDSSCCFLDVEQEGCIPLKGTEYECKVDDSPDNPACSICKDTPDECMTMGQAMWTDHCLQDGDSTFAEGLLTPETDVVLEKGINKYIDAYSIFMDNMKTHKTPLHDMLLDNGIDKVYVTGIATDFCVSWTAQDAADLGFEVVMIEDATAAIDIAIDTDATPPVTTVSIAMGEMAAKGISIVKMADVMMESCPTPCPDGCESAHRSRKLLFGSQPGGMYCPPGCVPMMTGRRLRLD